MAVHSFYLSERFPMFAFSSSLAEPMWLLFFGVIFLAVATGVQMHLTKKQRATGSEPNPLPTTVQSR